MSITAYATGKNAGYVRVVFGGRTVRTYALTAEQVAHLRERAEIREIDGPAR